MWSLAAWRDGEGPVLGYEATREAAIEAFAKSWRPGEERSKSDGRSIRAGYRDIAQCSRNVLGREYAVGFGFRRDCDRRGWAARNDLHLTIFGFLK
jgi:hypothetical protein